MFRNRWILQVSNLANLEYGDRRRERRWVVLMQMRTFFFHFVGTHQHNTCHLMFFPFQTSQNHFWFLRLCGSFFFIVLTVPLLLGYSNAPKIYQLSTVINRRPSLLNYDKNMTKNRKIYFSVWANTESITRIDFIPMLQLKFCAQCFLRYPLIQNVHFGALLKD